MNKADSERAYRRWRVEHARSPSEESTPRSAAADAAGEDILYHAIGYAALQRIKERSSKLALQLTRRSGMIKTLGSSLLEIVDSEDIPSRMEIHRSIIEEGEANLDDLVSDQIEERRRQLILNEIGDTELLALAVTLGQGESDGSREWMSVVELIEESEEDDIVKKAKQLAR